VGVMWSYFHDTLRWPLIRLKQGALTMLAEGGAGALDDVREAILWLRRQFLPATSEADYLTNYAASRSIVRHPSETDAQFKTRVVRAWYWHYLGGKQAGMPKMLALYGYTGANIINWRQYDADRWAEFWCKLLPPADQTFAAADYELLLWLLNEYKPARSKLVKLSIAVTESTSLGVGILAVQGDRQTLMARFEPQPASGSIIAWAGVVAGDRQTVPVVDLVLTPGRPPVYAAALVATCERLTVRSKYNG